MAKFSGDQNIPSVLLDAYRGTLNPHPTGNIVKKRYPFRMPKMQEGKPGVSNKQKTQRERFKKAITDFAGTESAERQRWYAAEPPWSSFLWYYNYFIMSSLSGNANIEQGGAGLIKSIQTVTMSIGAGSAEGSVNIDTIDPDKSVVMLNGASTNTEEGTGWYRSTTIYPYVSGKTATQIKCKWSIATINAVNTTAAVISATIIEYI